MIRDCTIIVMAALLIAFALAVVTKEVKKRIDVQGNLHKIQSKR